VTQSIRARFGFSLLANVSKAAISFGTGLLVARGLGPEQYGTMVFLLGTFTAARQLFDLGTSSAFFTFLSQRNRNFRFVGLYFFWLALQFLVTLLAVGLLFPDSWIDLIWRGEQRNLVILAFLAVYIQSVLWSAFLQMGESQRLTRWVQGVAVTVALAHLLLVVFAWWGKWLNIHTILILLIFEWLIAVAVIAKQLHFSPSSAEIGTAKSVFNEFWRYCAPLVLYSWLGFVYEFADRWLLQTYAGSVQQAYYAVAYQFGAIAAIATSSILNIFWKEIAEAHHQNNHERVAMLYQRVSKGLFFVAASCAGFLAPWAEDVLRITLGAAYVGGATTLAIMFFYPLHQSMGQIGGTLAYATGRVALQVKIGMVFMVASIVVTFFVLADVSAPLPGLGLGSLGLAGKMVVMQILGVNALAFCLSRSLGVKFDWIFQVTATCLCLTAGLVAYAVSQILFDVPTQIWVALPVAGIIYSMLLLIFLRISPNTAGLSKSDLTLVLNRFRLAWQ
jgi:O-antigen/teichoic acid export membrane protein